MNPCHPSDPNRHAISVVIPALDEAEGLGDTLQALAGMAELSADPVGSLRVGFTATTDGPVLNRLTEAFQARHPGCRASMHEVPVCDPFAALRKDEVDVVANWLVALDADLTMGPAIAYYDRVLAVSDDLDAMSGRAMCQLWLGQHDAARADVRACLVVPPPVAFQPSIIDPERAHDGATAVI